MKDFFKKLSRTQDDVEDLDTGYDSEYYQGSYDRQDRQDRRVDDRRVDDRRIDDRQDRGYAPRPDYDTPATAYPDNRYATPVSDPYAPRGWQESDAPAYRDRPEKTAEPVFAPEPAPEYLYYTPANCHDCREGIVRGLAAGHVVVVRLGELESADVLRLFDYMSGAVVALDGELVRPQATTVVLLPNGVELEEEALELDDEEFSEEDDDWDEEESEQDAE